MLFGVRVTAPGHAHTLARRRQVISRTAQLMSALYEKKDRRCTSSACPHFEKGMLVVHERNHRVSGYIEVNIPILLQLTNTA